MAKETVETLCQKAQQAITEGDHDLARTFFQQAIGLRSDNPDAHYGMATVCFLVDDLLRNAAPRPAGPRALAGPPAALSNG